ncbi:hypothetical protein TorRG33x02_044960 [Trema orientale]|uniref:Uncharacterized protein n=1 Tax=Trema orientale TaxID=63057 RepID=A0A2P5FPK2_TREOI|nr:hypothetical protein TorRG33x02_044960 [Trema orientale]
MCAISKLSFASSNFYSECCCSIGNFCGRFRRMKKVTSFSDLRNMLVFVFLRFFSEVLLDNFYDIIIMSSFNYYNVFLIIIIIDKIIIMNIQSPNSDDFRTSFREKLNKRITFYYEIYVT